MKIETERIWSSSGVRIDWLDSLEHEDTARMAGLTVLLEEGAVSPLQARSRNLLLAGLHRPARSCGWGWARLWARHIRQHVAAVRREGHPLVVMPTALTETLLGRALGRALAHEIGHYLLATADHRAYGLMRPHFAPQELLEGAIEPLYGLASRDRRQLTACSADRSSDAPNRPE